MAKNRVPETQINASEKIALSRNDVTCLLGISISILNRKVNAGFLPKPRFIGRRPVWIKSELITAIKELPREAGA